MSIIKEISHLPLRFLFKNLPAFPVDIEGMIDTLARLAIRGAQTLQAKQALTETFTINGVTDVAYAFLFGGTKSSAAAEALAALSQLLRDNPARVLSALFEKPLHEGVEAPGTSTSAETPDQVSLDDPKQFSMSWTTFPPVYQAGLPFLPAWTSSLTDADSATAQFWPMIAEHGFAYNLLIVEKVTGSKIDLLRAKFGSSWTAELDATAAAGNLYFIDMSRFEAFKPQFVAGAFRFTPATVTLLSQNPETKALSPVAIAVSGYLGQGLQLFTRTTATPSAWLYALQAAKTSITVFGIWIGHVYHWHLVTAAMQMTMFNTFPTDHSIYQLLSPQSKYAIPFDDVLLLLWSYIAPPTSISSPFQFLELVNSYAVGRSYFDDDPKTTLTKLGLAEPDFTLRTPWDQYPVVQRLLAVWKITEAYVDSFVKSAYQTDASIAGDRFLQTWMKSSSATDGGNIAGLPEMKTQAALANVLTSLVYRITAHGISRLNSTANPALTFVANFPHCLQRQDIPAPSQTLDTKALLAYLPNTNTISEAINFYFTFVFSPPYEPFIPLSGVTTGLFFPGGPNDPRNQALVQFRNSLVTFINDYQPGCPQRFQWPLNVET
jgi:Lipoxygenase